jgi:superfamily II DNA or RNA helicase
MHSDFVEYSKNNKWKVDSRCHCLFAGRSKDTEKRVVITTWQSIYKLPESYFKDFAVVFGDECHQFKAKSLTSIMSKLKRCPYRIGTTGTLDDIQIHQLVIEGLFGPVQKVTTTTELIEKKMLSNLEIDCILLQHDDVSKKQIKRAKYQEEIDWLVSNPKRNEFIRDLSLRLKGNTLILFQFVEKHGKVLHSMVKDTGMDRKVFFVHGGTDVEVREDIRHIVENENDAIIVASYGTFSTGISIRRLHNIIFASPSKSRIRVLQSIGRQLRTSKNKDKAKLYDIGDDLHWKSWKNHTLRHFIERIKIYTSEKFKHTIHRIRI